jgi:hypothetical protein
MPQNVIYNINGRKKPNHYAPLPAGIIHIDITEPTVIAVGSGTYYGFYINSGPLVPSRVQLRISDADSLNDYPGDGITDFHREEWGFGPPYKYALYYGSPIPDYMVPPYGQLIRPFTKGLAVRGIPPGVDVTIWYTSAVPLLSERAPPRRRELPTIKALAEPRWTSASASSHKFTTITCETARSTFQDAGKDC